MLENLPHQFQQSNFIFDEQNGFFASPDVFGFIGRIGGCIDGFTSHRKKHFESGADAHFALDFEPAMMLFDNAINGGQSQPSSLADFLGREKRLKNPLQHLGFHAATSICHGQADEPTHTGFRVLSQVGGVNFSGGSRDDKFAALGHGITRVDRQIHHNLLDHPGIRLNARQFRLTVDFQRDILADQPRKHASQILQHRIQIENLRSKNLLATEREQLPDETGRALRCRGNLLY